MQTQFFKFHFLLPVTFALLQFGGVTPASAATFEQSGSNGVVSIEAEQFASRTSRNGQSWRVSKASGTSGGRAMQALPNNQVNNNTGFVTRSPRLDYKVDFRRTGKHYVWIRGFGSSLNDDSLHVGLNGQAQAGADGITGFSGNFRWSHETMDGVRATINVTRIGEQTLNVWMREDGMNFDKIVLTTSQSLDPYDFGVMGPATSSTTDGGGSGGSSEPPVSSTTLISVEAEAFESKVARNGHEWRQVSASATSGGSAVKSFPNTDVNYDSSYTSVSPRLNYKIEFDEAGDYYVWVRGLGSSPDDDSLHIGLNGQADARADRISGFANRMSWSNDTMDGRPAMLRVSQAGVQTLNVWMREDGMTIDKIVLTRDSSFNPSDYGAYGPDANQPPSSSGGSDSGGSSEPPVSSATLISVEAEAFEAKANRNGQYWRRSSASAASGGGAVKSLPNIEAKYDTGYVSASPRLDYTIDFAEAGDYYVWVRGLGSSLDDDSLHVGLNGKADARADRISGFPNRMSWSNDTMDGRPAMLRVPRAGVQTLNVWMREDGMVIDKIVLTKDSSLDPADYGAYGPASNQPPSSGGGSPGGEGGSGTSNSPPKVSGTPPKTVVQGDQYDFRPNASDADGDTVSWSISRRPGWASFSSSTGRLRGTPTAANVGQYRDIVVTASDGKASSSLEPFTITVVASGNTSITLTWTPPTRNTDGSALRDLAGYELRWGRSGGALNQTRRISNPGVTSYVVENLETGEYKFVLRALNSAGNKSDPSNAAYTTVN